MEHKNETTKWESLSKAEKKHQLFLNQKTLLDRFLKTGAITKIQHDKSLGDLIVKMGEAEETEG